MQYSEMLPAYHNLPRDYKYNENFNLFYEAYLSSSYKFSYDDAKSRCRDDGAYLATPRSYDENKFLIHTFTDTNLWIGLDDINKEDRFVSVDGHKVSYFRWSEGEPNNAHGNEDAVHIIGDSYYGTKGKWNDEEITTLFNFVCFRRI